MVIKFSVKLECSPLSSRTKTALYSFGILILRFLGWL